MFSDQIKGHPLQCAVVRAVFSASISLSALAYNHLGREQDGSDLLEDQGGSWESGVGIFYAFTLQTGRCSDPIKGFLFIVDECFSPKFLQINSIYLFLAIDVVSPWKNQTKETSKFSLKFKAPNSQPVTERT